MLQVSATSSFSVVDDSRAMAATITAAIVLSELVSRAKTSACEYVRPAIRNCQTSTT